MQLIRGLNAEFIFMRCLLPMGGKGLVLRNGVVTPSPDEVGFMAAQTGVAARIGERAQITNMVIHDRSIVFEINGGIKKKKKWYQHISIGTGSAMTPIAPDRSDQNPHGGQVTLEFDRFVPDLTPDQVKQLLHPIFDFNALSATQAYVDTMPPKVAAAMKAHQVLVGMNRDMVNYSLGRPDQKVRDTDERGAYEEWIYGAPPDPVQFVRFYGDVVGRVEIMQVSGEKQVRTQPEIAVLPSGQAQVLDADHPAPVASAAPAPAAAPVTPYKPSLMKPGETAPDNSERTNGTPTKQPVPNGLPLPPDNPQQLALAGRAVN